MKLRPPCAPSFEHLTNALPILYCFTPADFLAQVFCAQRSFAWDQKHLCKSQSLTLWHSRVEDQEGSFYKIGIWPYSKGCLWEVYILWAWTGHPFTLDFFCQKLREVRGRNGKRLDETWWLFITCKKGSSAKFEISNLQADSRQDSLWLILDPLIWSPSAGRAPLLACCLWSACLVNCGGFQPKPWQSLD